MTIGKREKILLAVLGVLLYGFLFYKFILIPVMPEIKEKNQQLTRLSEKKEALDQDVRNMELKKLGKAAKEAENEALDEVLLNNANVADSIEYIDLLSKLVDSDLTNVQLAQPVKRTTQASGAAAGGKEFYEFKISFKTILTYEKLLELIDTMEGGSKKVRISSFSMKMLTAKELEKLKTDQLANHFPVRLPDMTGKKAFSADISMNLYALNLGNADKLYEYSRHKFNNFSRNHEEIPFIAPEIDAEGAEVPQTNSSPDPGAAENPADGADIAKKVDISSADVVILETSFLSAGNNLQIFGSNKFKDLLAMDTKSNVDIHLKLDSAGYSIQAAENGQNRGNMNCSVPKEDLEVYVSLDFPFIKENENLGICLQVSNESERNIYIKLDDKVSRLKLKDAHGNDLNGSGGSQRVYLV